MTRRLLEYGTEGVLVECADLGEVLGLMAALEADPIPGVEEAVPGARTLLLRLARPLTGGERSHLQTRQIAPPAQREQPEVRIEVDYDGEDIEEVAGLTGRSPEAVIDAHTGQLWTVGFCGFAPGFAYLQGENDALRVARRDRPRTKVPAGSVGLADTWSGIYPREGPGGWQLIGRTDAVLWDVARRPPALLRPGTRVRFVDRAAS